MPATLVVVEAKDIVALSIRWKLTIQLAITLQEPLARHHVELIRHPEKCATGRWLDSSYTLSMRSHRAYHDLSAKHVEFHEDMERIVNLIDQRRFEEAARSIDGDSHLSRSAKALALAAYAYDQVEKAA